ncbi:MAG: hypothetical protein JO088_22605, partial [Acidobacteria bacterium]|nr:hypothetical protein [Acidobacteriota bacterium]
MSAIPFEQKSIFESELLQFLEPTSSPEPAAGAEVVQQALQTQLKLPEQRLEQRVAAIKHATTRKKLEPGLLKEAQQEQQLAELAFKLVEPQLQVASAIAGSGYVKPLSQSMAIGTSFNTMNVSSRYFRVLVWNLENFTSDSRPRGSAPISRRRNQARIAAVVAAVRNFGARLLFIMETGADVGQATTDIATMLQQTTGAAWEPLTTPMTHEQPKMAEVYENVTLGRVSGRRVLALRLLGDFYDIAPNLAGLPEEVTIDQITDACHVLIDASSFVKGLGESY